MKFNVNFNCNSNCITDLGSLIGNTQCENFWAFLPFRFYVKSILVVLKPPKTAILTIWVAMNFEFRAAQTVKMAVFGASKRPKLISRKIWVSWNFHSAYSQFGCPGLYYSVSFMLILKLPTSKKVRWEASFAN